MWTKLSADKKSELMKAYKKGGFSYRDMIDDYNASYKKFDLGGETDDLTKSGVATLPNNDYNKLTKEQLDILKRQGNLDVVKKWYDENPEDMEGFNQWINTYNSSDLISKYQEKQAKFDEALKNSRDWNNEWYKKRATLPQFKDVATERLNTSNQLSTELSDPINLSIDWWNKTGKPPEVFYAPEIGGITRNNKAKININDIRTGDVSIEAKDPEPFFENSYFTDAKGRLQNSLITHEENHERDFIAPQIGTKQHVNKFKWGEGNNLDPIEKIITKEEQLNDPRNEGYSNSYQQQPTEVRSRLQVWRQINNIDPLKKYSNEEIDKIIKSNLNNPNINSNIKELLETLKNDPEKLNYLNNTYVSINNNNQLPIAKMGGMMKMGGIQKYQEGGIEESINKRLGDPMNKAEIDSDYKRPTVDPRTRRQKTSEPVDNVRHAAAGRYTQEAIENYANLIPYASAIPGFSKAAGFIGSNILGLGHEASTLFNNDDDDTRTMGMKIKESAADAYNNMIGSVIGASNLTPYQKKAYMIYLSETGKMPTGQYNKKKDPTYKKINKTK